MVQEIVIDCLKDFFGEMFWGLVQEMVGGMVG